MGDFTGQGSEYLWNIGVGEEGWNSGSGDCTQAPPRDLKVREQVATRDSCAVHRPGTDAYNGQLAAIKAGLRLGNVHASRDGTLDIIFQMLDQAIQEGAVTLDQIRERRFYFDHGTTIRPEQIPLIKKYGLTITFQGGHLWNGPEIEKKYGVEYLKWLVPWGSMAKEGVPFVVTTDQHLGPIPVEAKLSRSTPFGGIWPAVESFITRDIGGRVWVPTERIDRLTAIRGLTTWAAMTVLREKDLGSLEEGKLADFVVIDKDYFTIPENEIHTIKNLMTVVGGKTAYLSSEF